MTDNFKLHSWPMQQLNQDDKNNEANNEQLKAKNMEMEAKLKVMEAKLKEKEQSIAKLKADLKAKLKASNEQSEAKLKVVEAKLKDAVIDTSCLATMNRTYYLEDSNGKRRASQPPLTINSEIAPHIKKKKKQEETQQAVKILSDSGAWNGIGEIVIPTKRKRKNGTCISIQSQLGAEAIDSEHGNMNALAYINEACVQNLVLKVVEDAVRCSGLEKLLKTHQEMSVFSSVPDVVVVSLNDGKPLFFVEVKTPERNAGEVFQAADVINQVFNYLMAFKRMGQETPVGALCTYDMLTIVTVDDITQNPNKTTHNALITRFKEKFKNESQVTETLALEKKTSCDTDVPSPLKKKANLIDDKTCRNGAKDEDQVVDSKIFMSKRFTADSGGVLKGVIAVLYAAREYNKSLDDDDVLLEVVEGDSLTGLVLPRVSKDGMKWVTVANGVHVSYKQFPKADADYFYLIAHVGRGSCGKVFSVSSTEGRMGAVKLRIPARPTEYTADDRQEQETKNLADKTAEQNNEFNRWRELYPKLPCREMVMNGIPALLMVYGKQLDAEQRKANLEVVEKELKRFAEMGYVYKDSDLRWRHVVVYNGKIMLIDLESLVAVKDKSEKEKLDLVADQMKRLKIYMSDQPCELSHVMAA